MTSHKNARGAPRDLRDDAVDLMMGALRVDDPGSSPREKSARAESVDAPLGPGARYHANWAEYQADMRRLEVQRENARPCVPDAPALLRLDGHLLATVACEDALMHRDLLTAVGAMAHGATQGTETLAWLGEHPGPWHGALWSVHNVEQGLDETDNWVLELESAGEESYWCCKLMSRIEDENVDARLAKFFFELLRQWAEVWSIVGRLQAAPSPEAQRAILKAYPQYSQHSLEAHHERMLDVLNRSADTVGRLPMQTQQFFLGKLQELRAVVPGLSAAKAQGLPNGPLKTMLQLPGLAPGLA